MPELFEILLSNSMRAKEFINEGYGKYWCSTDKKWKTRQGPKQTRRSKSVKEEWSQKYKNSINCSNPKGFSQRAHCQGQKK